MTLSFDKSLLVPCPTLRPLIEEFSDPIKYFSRDDVAELGRVYGLLKIIPPQEWQPPLSVSEDFRFHHRGRSRRLRDSFVVEGKSIYYYDLHLRYLRESQSKSVKSNDAAALWSNINRLFGIPSESKAIKKEFGACIQDYTHYLGTYQFQSNPFLRDEESDDDQSDAITILSESDAITILSESDAITILSESEEENDQDHLSPCKACGSNVGNDYVECNECEHVFHLECARPRIHLLLIHKWYCLKCLIGSGEYGFEENVDVKYTLEQFEALSAEFIRNYAIANKANLPLLVDWIESMFWDVVEKGELSVEVKYGADIPGALAGFSAIPETSLYARHPFSLHNLPSAKGSLLNYVDSAISGMQLPWVYVGSLLLTFCWHVEDHYTLLANYCHKGATKKWYGINSENADRFESMVRLLAPDMFERQPDLLHQLVTLVLPMTLHSYGIPCTYVDQNEGEFVVTYPRVYHAGFNCGFNINEAVNFAIPQWLTLGEQALSHYQPIRKENAFSHYRMVQLVLENRCETDRKLIKECADSMRAYVATLQHKMRKIENTHQVQRVFAKMGNERLCGGCKTYLAHFCCLVSPSKTPNKTHGQLLTPQSSPNSDLPVVKNLPICEMDAFSTLIENAKQVSKEPAHKRRRLRGPVSTALPELKASPSFTTGTMRLFKSATSLYICLDCCERYFGNGDFNITIICETSITTLCHAVDMRLQLALS